MNDAKNNITLLKCLYDKSDDYNFIKHGFEIYFPKIFKYIIDNFDNLHIDIEDNYEILKILEKHFNCLEEI